MHMQNHFVPAFTDDQLKTYFTNIWSVCNLIRRHMKYQYFADGRPTHDVNA